MPHYHLHPQIGPGKSKATGRTAKSEDEAALSIQTNFRGYITRKEVAETKGFKCSAESSTYDTKTTRLLRKCCYKWRRRSMFQMLLLYRSVRQQDLVYFCQQAHVYNQGAMDGLKDTEKQIISQDKIKAVKQGEAALILGRQPVFARKVPFQFHMLPFFDTSHFCDPADAGLNSMYSNKRNPRDFDTWDAPLRRKKMDRGSNRSYQRNNKKLRDQGCQTGGATEQGKFNKGIGVNQTNNPHIQTPFRRELLDNQPKMPKKVIPRQRSPGPSTSASAPRVDASANDVPIKSVSAVRGQFESSNGSSSQSARVGARPPGHIQELKNLGKEMSGTDTGTFNFQGMLRKTNFSRGSMKRNDIYSPDDGPSSFKISSYQQDNNKMWEKSELDQKKGKSPSYSAVVKQKQPKVGFNDGRRHELAPGVVVEGEECEL